MLIKNNDICQISYDLLNKIRMKTSFLLVVAGFVSRALCGNPRGFGKVAASF